MGDHTFYVPLNDTMDLRMPNLNNLFLQKFVPPVGTLISNFIKYLVNFYIANEE